MNLIGKIYATPSRVRGAYNFLLYHEGQCATRQEMELCLSPLILWSGKGKKGDMVREVIRECIKLSLFIEDEQIIYLNQELSSNMAKRKLVEQELPYYLCHLIFQSREHNDLCNILAWYLCQDIYKAPSNWPEVEDALKNQVGEGKLGLNSNAAYGQFEDWSCFLGIASLHGLKKPKEQTFLIPDITKYLRWEISELLFHQPGHQMPMRELFSKLSQRCPVIEGGHYRVEIEKKLGISRDVWHFSTTTSHALVRLLEENTIKLQKESDADVCILDLGSEGIQPYSDISLAN